MAPIDTLRTLQEQDERIRTLEDALRPFAEEQHRPHPTAQTFCGFCARHFGTPDSRWPCKYETARRALEGE